MAEDFEEGETLLAHVDANQGWKIDIDTLVNKVAGVATRSYEERLARDSPHIAGEFVPVNSDAVIVYRFCSSFKRLVSTLRVMGSTLLGEPPPVGKVRSGCVGGPSVSGARTLGYTVVGEVV